MRPSAISTAMCLLYFASLHAQLPELTSSDKQTPIKLQKLELSVKILGTRASTSFTMTFYNSGDKILAGNFLLPMPAGANVTRYALDVNGRMREAVPVEKVKATQVFESVEKRKIDPGLLEKTEGNVFRTRIYPIPPQGQRTIIITYEQELSLSGSSEVSYYLPFPNKDSLSRFSITIDIQQKHPAPTLESTPLKDLKLLLHDGRYCANAELENIRLDTALSIRMLTAPSHAESLVQKRNGEYFFFLQSFLPASVKEKKPPRRLNIVWDNSLSGIYRDAQKEQQFLAAYLKQLNTATINLYSLNNALRLVGTFAIQGGSAPELEKKISDLSYDGGTDYSKIILPAADETVLFSDGLSSLSEPKKFLAPHPVYAVNSSPRSDNSTLIAIAGESGGGLVDLQTQSLEDAIATITREPLRFLGIRPNATVEELYPNTPTPVQNGFTMAGKMRSPDATIILQFGYGRKVAFERRVRLDFDAYTSHGWDLKKLFAQKKIEQLEKEFDKNKDKILSLGKEHGIVTRNTSLLVLEDVMDYVRHDIEPPSELRSEYKRLLKERMEELSRGRDEVLENAIGFSESLKRWWNTSYPVKEKKTSKIFNGDSSSGGMNTSQIPPPPPPLQQPSIADEMQNVNKEEEEQPVRRSLTVGAVTVNDVVVVGYTNALRGSAPGISVTPQGSQSTPYQKMLLIVDGRIAAVMPAKEKIKSVEVLDPKPAVAIYGSAAVGGVIIIATRDAIEGEPEIKLNERTSTAVYMQTLASTPQNLQYQTYLELRDKNLLNPTFYYDMAGFFMHRNRALGMQILTNLGELDFENHELYKLFAFKLKEIGEANLALHVFKKILLWRPQEPQSYRDYALALADMGHYQAALDTLYLALTRKYDENVSERFEGFEETIVTELNRLISEYKSALNTKAINKKLVQHMPVDIRVVLNWNMNDVDIDLWITDPSGEKCFYKNTQTKNGGHMSEDFTEGYGPEQFMLKKALKGKYKIEVDYYGESSPKIAGKTTLLVEVFTNYGRPNERRKLITLQLDGEDQKSVYVGEFEF